MSSARSLAPALGIYGVWYWIDRENFPGPLLGGVAVLFVLGIQGFILALVGEYLGRIQRDVEGRPLYTIDGGRARSTAQARSRHRRRRVHRVQLHPPPARATPYEVVSLDALTYAGNPENLADVMAHERLSFVHGDIRDADLVARSSPTST